MSYISITIRTIARTLALAGVLCLAGALAVTGWHMVRHETAPRAMASTLRADGPAFMTGALGTWRGDLPRARAVRVVQSIQVQGQAAPENGVWAGQYDPVTGGIEIIRASGDITLAHEYGHALLQDLIVREIGEGAPALALFQQLADTSRSTDPSGVPAWLRGVFDEYRRLPAAPYGDSYYGDSFNEYFAESFAWTAVRDGMDVSPAARAFFADLERASARSAR